MKTRKNLLKLVFFIYLLILAKLILFKGALFFSVVPTSTEYIRETKSKTFDSYNLVPFRSIYNYVFGHVTSKEFFFNIFGNIMLFVPFGFLLPALWCKAKQLGIMAIAAFVLSFLFETYQLTTHTGQFDVDDIILNTMGGVTGYLLYTFAKAAYANALRPTQLAKQ